MNIGLSYPYLPNSYTELLFICSYQGFHILCENFVLNGFGDINTT